MNIKSLGAVFAAVLLLLVQTCSLNAAGKSALPTGVIRAGSLCNKKLIFDTSVAATGKLAQMGYTYDVHRHTYQPYVVAMPKGAPGERRWTERWVYSIDGKEVPITIDFSEAGLGAADFTIRR
jgi:hypothetical protein